MVFFTCDACGESLKKAQVEKHVLKCRSCQVLSCIDCGKDFRGDDYKSHNRCISEDQKYGGRDFQAKANKGDVKQQQWIERVQQAISRPGVDSGLQQVLRRLSAYENVPRKRAKFENWMKNCLKIHSPLLLQQVWEILSTAADTNGNQMNQETTKDLNNGTETSEDKRENKKKKKKKTSEEQNGHETCEKQTKKSKRKREQNTEENTKKRQKKSQKEVSDESLNVEEEEEPENQETEANTTAGKFNWKGTIKAVLRDAPEDGLAVKKLRKKVLSAYYSFSGDTNYRSEEELLSLFNRKINTNPKFRILKDRVRLVR